MRCSHCLRGPQQNVTIERSSVLDILENVASIGSLTLSGGEPFLAQKTITEIVGIINHYQIKLGSFNIPTNGKSLTMAKLEKIHYLREICEDKSDCTIVLSNDTFHDSYTNKFDKLRARFEREYGYNMLYRDRLIDGEWYAPMAEGRALQQFPKHVLNAAPGLLGRIKICRNEITGTFYLNALGEVIEGCDYSYRNQKDHKVCNASDFSLEAVEKYVLNREMQKNKCLETSERRF